jgi:hypothetical protein
MPFLKQKYQIKKRPTPATPNKTPMAPTMVPACESLGSVDEVLDDEATVKETKCKM